MGGEDVNVRKQLANLICNGQVVLTPSQWLAEEACSLATRIRNLDEIPPQAILPLAKLVAEGEADAKQLELGLGMDSAMLEGYLDKLCELQFAEQTWSGYRATPAGWQAFDAIGWQMVNRELVVLQGRVERLLRLQCVFRRSVTARFGIVTAEFGSVTDRFGDVTDGRLVVA